MASTSSRLTPALDAEGLRILAELSGFSLAEDRIAPVLTTFQWLSGVIADLENYSDQLGDTASSYDPRWS